MKHNEKEKRNPHSHELIREMIELYHPQSVKDIQEMLKDMFANTDRACEKISVKIQSMV